MTDWVRLWHDMPTDPKWRVIARKSGQPLPCVIAVFNLLMVAASQNAIERGVVAAWDDEDAGAALDMDGDAVKAIREAMQGKVLDGFRLSGWGRRQPKREDDSAERVKAYRERQRAQADAEKRRETGDAASVTQRNAPETETDAETERVAPNGACAISIGWIGLQFALLDWLGSQDEPLEPQHIADEWNATASKLAKPRIRDLTPERRQLVRARIGQYSLDDFAAVFAKVERSPFLRGETGWPGCTFDWLMKKSNFQKVLEGNYDQ